MECFRLPPPPPPIRGSNPNDPTSNNTQSSRQNARILLRSKVGNVGDYPDGQGTPQSLRSTIFLRLSSFRPGKSLRAELISAHLGASVSFIRPPHPLTLGQVNFIFYFNYFVVFSGPGAYPFYFV